MRYACIITAAMLMVAATPISAQTPASAYPPATVLKSLGVNNGEVDALLESGSPEIEQYGDRPGTPDPSWRGHDERGRPHRFAWFWDLPFEWRRVLHWYLTHRHQRYTWSWDRWHGWHQVYRWYWNDDHGWNRGRDRGRQRNDWDRNRDDHRRNEGAERGGQGRRRR